MPLTLGLFVMTVLKYFGEEAKGDAESDENVSSVVNTITQNDAD